MINELKNIWDKNINNDKLQVYIDNPFCTKKCSYCVYYGDEYDYNNYGFYYKNFLPKYINTFKEIINKFDDITYWFGGGTPNIMTEDDMESIFSLLELNKNNHHKIIEVNPDILTFKQIDIFKKYNFNTIAMGVQTFEENILKKNNRNKVSPERIKELINYIHMNNMYVSVDLLMLEDSTEFIDDLFTILDCNVDEICATYEYKLEFNENFKKINKVFSDIVLFFMDKSKFKCNIDPDKILKHMESHANVRLFKNQDILKYESDTNFFKCINNINILGLGTWFNRKIFSKIGDIRYETTLKSTDELDIKYIT